MSPLLKAIAIGVGVFVLAMLLFWGISRLAGQPFLILPPRPVARSVAVSPTPVLPFLQ